ncbi:MAG: hypothetical protein WBX00_15130 [Isosphaeraceae bacterium]
MIRQLAIIHEFQGDLDTFIVINDSVFPLGVAPWTTQRPTTPATTVDLVVVFGAIAQPTL